MTTIAVRDGIIASDSQMSRGDRIVGEVQKLFLATNGKVYAGCGDYPQVLDIIQSLCGYNGYTPSKDATIIEASKDCLRVYESAKTAMEFNLVDGSFYAFGSGADFAIGAMAAGASAEEAVRIACKYDVWSGGEVQFKCL